jgi:glucose-1-phosphate thymidylyltransferase
MKGLILAGGRGTRLRPLTFTGNKHMIPIANQPILFYGLRNLANAGIRDVAVVLGPIEEGIRESVGDGKSFGLNVEYIIQGDPKGLAHAVLCAREFLGADPFLMYLGDNLLQSGVSPFVERFRSEQPDAVVGATPVSHPRAYGIVELSGNQIVSIEEKPANPRSNLALIGVYLFTEAIHPIVAKLSPSRRGELEITDAIWRLWESRRRVSVLTVSGWWKDTGHPEDLLEANELILRTMPSEGFIVEGVVRPGAFVEGRVSIGPGTIIDSSAKIVGPTIIGSEVQVGGGTQIGPFCAIGNRAILNQASVRRSIVLDGARLDGVHLTDSLVGRNVEVKVAQPMDRELTLTIGDSSRIRF